MKRWIGSTKRWRTLQRQDHPPTVVSYVYGNRGLLWLRLGQPEHALADLERCRAAAERADNDDLRALSLAYLAEAYSPAACRTEHVIYWHKVNRWRLRITYRRLWQR